MDAFSFVFPILFVIVMLLWAKQELSSTLTINNEGPERRCQPQMTMPIERRLPLKETPMLSVQREMYNV